jgi:hypothetical protein
MLLSGGAYVPAEQAFSYRCSEPLSSTDVKLGALPSRRRLVKSRPSTYDFQGGLGRDPPIPAEVQRKRRASLPLSSNPPFPTIPMRVSSLGYFLLFHIKRHCIVDDQNQLYMLTCGCSGPPQTPERATQSRCLRRPILLAVYLPPHRHPKSQPRRTAR